MQVVTRKTQVEPERLLDVVVDVTDWPRWTESMTSVRRLDDGPLMRGSRAEVTQPKLRPSVWEVTQIRRPGDPMERDWAAALAELPPEAGSVVDAFGFIWTAHNPGVVSVGGHFVVPAGRVSRLVLTVEHSGPLAFLVRSLVGRRAAGYVDLEADGMLEAAAERA